MPANQLPKLWGIIVTYHRPVELGAMLRAVALQTRPPDHVVVVDNGSDDSARDVAQAAGATYIDAQENLGPAGGVALAMGHILSVAGDNDWVLSLDDDDPPLADDLIEGVWHYGLDRIEVDPLTAGVGMHGADYNHKLGTFRRYEDQELTGDLVVSVVAGGSLPMYRISTLRKVGVFEPALFFGFEEGEFGLRIKDAGLRLYVQGKLARRARQLWGQWGKSSSQVRTAPGKAAWRRYYSVRNSTLLAHRYASRWAPLYTGLGGAAKGTIALLQQRRPLREVILPLRGAMEGLLRRSGRTINPARSYK